MTQFEILDVTNAPLALVIQEYAFIPLDFFFKNLAGEKVILGRE